MYLIAWDRLNVLDYAGANILEESSDQPSLSTVIRIPLWSLCNVVNLVTKLVPSRYSFFWTG